MLSRPILLTLSLVLACTTNAQAQAQKPSFPTVVVSKVTEAFLRKTLWFNATVVSQNDATLSSESDARILAIAEVGDRFVAGQTVATLHDPLLQRDLKEHRATVASQQYRIDFLKNETERLRKLAKKNNASINRLEEVQADLGSSTSMKEAAQARVLRTLEIVRQLTIVTPFSGIVTNRMAELGEWVKAGSQLVEIVDLQNPEIQAWLPFHVLPYVAEGAQLAIKWQEQKRTATVRAIIPVGSEKSRLFEIRMDPGAAPVHIGELVQVEVPVEAPRQVLIVPEDALVIRHDGITVFAVDENMKARRVAVTPGLSDGNGNVEVTGALQAGNTVVIRGGERLRSGLQVSLQKSAP